MTQTLKTVTAMESGLSLSAGGGDDTGATLDLTDGFGGTINIKITNGATGPTLPAQVQIEVSEDNFTENYDFGGPFVGGVANSEEVSWGGIVIPAGINYIRTVQGSNTGQAVTVDIDFSEIEDIALAT